jgi:large subunit ribosomal protein L21
MYAIIKTGGKQYSVDRGDRLFVEKLDVEPGAQVEFDKVLYLNADDFTRAGTPYLDAVRVIGTAVENGKAKKTVTFKYKAKKDYRKKQGHRQPYTLVEINSITVDGEAIGGKIEETVGEQAAPAEGLKAEAQPEVEVATERIADAEETADAGEPAKSDTGKAEATGAETPAKKPAAKRTAKPKAEKADAETPAEKPAAKRTAKPKAEKADADEPAKPKTEKTETSDAEAPAKKPAAKRTAKPKAEKADAGETAKPEADKADAVPAEKPAAKRTAKPKVKNEHADAAPAAPEEEK